MALSAELAVEGLSLAWRVRRVEHNERLGELFETVVTIDTNDDPAPLQDSIGAGATLRWAGPGPFTRISGIVRRVRHVARVKLDGACLEIEIVSPLWLLTQRIGHRIFRDVSVGSLADLLLGEHLNGCSTEKRLREDHPTRDYTVQYAESDWDFLRRVLADEGCCLAIAHDRGGLPVLLDDTSGATEPVRAPFLPGGGSLGNDDSPRIFSATISSELRPGRVVLRDYDYERPALHLGADSETPTESREGGLEQYLFEVGTFGDERGGQARAKRLLDERRVGERVLVCETNFSVSPGQFLALVDHPSASADGEWLVIGTRLSIGVEGSNRTWSCSLECMPASASFRVPRRSKPRISGTQTAVVIGSPDEIIDVDELGRVETAFRWDRRDPSGTGATRRVRVSQAWAGAGYGLTTLPRRGDEVVVSFIDGNPDEPIIIGQVHNGARPFPIGLPAEKSQSIWRSQSFDQKKKNGFNQIVLDDAAGGERLEFRAERDWIARVLANSRTSVGGSQSTTVGGSQSTSVGSSQSTTVGESRSITVGGDQSTSIGGSASETVGESKLVEVIENQNVRVGEEAHLEANVASFDAIDRFFANAPVVTIQADQRLDENKTSHTIVAPTTTLTGSEVQVIVSSEILLLMGASIVRVNQAGIELTSYGSRIAMTPEGISIESPGVVDIKGALIKLNS